VPAKLTAPGPGVAGGLLKAGEWQVGVSFRSLHSFRDFQGSEAIPVPSPPALYASTHLNTVDIGVTYAVTNRFSISAGVPLQIGTRETSYEHDGVSLHTMRAAGVGDVRVTGSVWLLDPVRHPSANASVGLGVKTPSGDSDASDYSFRPSGKVLRPVDPAIQLGDGGWGALVTGQAFARIGARAAVFGQAAYLVSPREMNRTQSPYGDEPDLTGGDIGYIVDSVPDQYFLRFGAQRTIAGARGLAASLALRLDGVPARDFVGGSDGYRLPGYSLALEPGLTIAQGRGVFALAVPIAIVRHASFSVADRRTGNPIGGIAALADAVLNVSYSRRF